MKELRISRRTLQRWIYDLEIDSLEFEDHLKVFLTLPNIEAMRKYQVMMNTKNPTLIGRYRDAISTGDTRRQARLLKEAKKGK